MVVLYKILKWLFSEWKFLLWKYHFLWSHFFWKILIVGLTIFFLMVFPLKVIEFYNQPFPVQVVSKQKVLYSFDFCKFYDYPFTLIKVLVDEKNGQQWYLEELDNTQRSPVKNDCDVDSKSKITVATTIPEYIPSGEYHMKIQIIYKINFLHKKNLDLATQNFTIN